MNYRPIDFEFFSLIEKTIKFVVNKKDGSLLSLIIKISVCGVEYSNKSLFSVKVINPDIISGT